MNFEIICIDNHCNELEAQFAKTGMSRDKGGEYLSSLATASRPWLKYLTYDKKLSHWQAKNAGVQASTGEILWFCDAHCIPSQGSLLRMLRYYLREWRALNGTLHMPLSYMLEKPGLELIYKLITDLDKGIVHYSFTRYRDEQEPYRVPCMSTCGMMMHRSIFDKLGGWPTRLGIYGGGEHFINFTLAILGMTVNIFPTDPLFHYAAKRGYYWNYDDYHRNRTVATYMFGGKEMALRYITNVKGRPLTLRSIYDDVIASGAEHRRLIESQAVTTIQDWVAEQTTRK